MATYKSKITFSDDRQSECLVDLDNSNIIINTMPSSMTVREHQFMDYVLYSLTNECKAIDVKKVEIELE